MIPRYSLPEIADLFTDEARFGAWLEVEVLAVEAWAQLGVVPPDAARAVRERARVDVAAVHEREKITDHDVAAFVDIVQASVGQPEGAWVHYGLTSSDVVDTALALQMTRALDVIEPAAAALESAIAARAREFRDTPMVGRTHGIHAEPTTFGMKLALWAMQVRRDRERLMRARDAIAVGKLSGAVGTFSNVDPAVERYVCEHLGLTPVPATQVLARDRHAEVLYACASVGATVESFATEIRHLQRTELREAEEAFREGEQKGSSAMPHKRNPVKSEQLSGLARVLRGNLSAALEDVALWHERDISHSSVERIIVPDSLLLAYYVLVQFTKLVTNLRVYPERMLRNLDASFGLVFSQPVLLALVEAGASRDDAYRLVQRNAMRAWQEERSFRELLAEDADVRAVLDDARLDACFDLKRALANVGRTFDELDRMEAAPPTPRGDEHDRASAPLLGQGPRALRGGPRPIADGRERPGVGVRRRAPRRDPRQGPGAHRAVAVLVRPDRRSRAQPRDLVRSHRLPRDRRQRRRPGDAREGDAARSARMRRAGLPVRARVDGIRGAGHRRWLPGSDRTASGRAPPGAAVHADDQGGVRPRPPAHRERGRRPGRRRPLRAPARPFDPHVRVGRARARTRTGSCSPTRSSSSARSTARCS